MVRGWPLSSAHTLVSHTAVEFTSVLVSLSTGVFLYRAEVKMKCSLGFCLLLFCALMGLGSAIRCVSCKDYTGSCTKQKECSYDDACLTLYQRGGQTFRQCLKYSDCEYSRLSQMFPHVNSFTFKCCNSDLCNSAPSSATSSLIGLLASVGIVYWWTQ